MSYQTNKEFIDELNETISKYIPNIEKVSYEVWAREVNGRTLNREFVIITYRGGAIAARNVNMNSLSANFREIGRLLDGGYYDEVESYQAAKSKDAIRVI